MFKIIGLFFAFAIAGLLLAAAFQPAEFRVQRTVLIDAPRPRIYGLIDDFHRWGGWSPYEQLDPDMQRNYSGAGSGLGAVYAWDSKGKAGVGRMEIIGSAPTSKLQIRLDFVKPFACSNTAEFTLQPKGDAIEVSWAIYGQNAYLAKVMSLLFDIDQMVGRDFEAGLANLKALAEKPEPFTGQSEQG